jgi:CheY-like chemotaxis protein
MDAQTPQSGDTVLWVDDDPDTCDLLTVLLGSIGYKVIATTSVSEALELATWAALP